MVSLHDIINMRPLNTDCITPSETHVTVATNTEFKNRLLIGDLAPSCTLWLNCTALWDIYNHFLHTVLISNQKSAQHFGRSRATEVTWGSTALLAKCYQHASTNVANFS